MTEGYWLDPNNRRQFFARFALKHSIDPLNAEDWYTVSVRKLHKEKVEKTGEGEEEND